MKTFRYHAVISGIHGSFPEKVHWIGRDFKFLACINMLLQNIEGERKQDQVIRIKENKDGNPVSIQYLTTFIEIPDSFHLGVVNSINSSLRAICKKHGLKFEANIVIPGHGNTEALQLR